MSRISNNHLVKGARGNFAKEFVYKKRGKNTHIAKMPEVDKNRATTEKQEEVREQFSSASLYAAGAISSPDLKKLYEKKASGSKTAYNIAFRDYLKAPVVKSIDTGKYNGSPGSVIVVKPKDDFRVAEVTLRIQTAAGALIEEGNAILNPTDRNKWNYTATQMNAVPAGSVIIAVAKDLPGNTGELQVTV